MVKKQINLHAMVLIKYVYIKFICQNNVHFKLRCFIFVCFELVFNKKNSISN